MKAVIFGCSAEVLTPQERALFRRTKPLGFILFARNCQTPAGVRRLVEEMKEASGREDAWILIDQEGGRVARLRPPHWRKTPPAGVFAALAEREIRQAEQAAYLNARLIAGELRALGISVDCAPVADLKIEGAHDIIGDRAYGRTPEQVARLARAMAQGLMDGGVLPVLKHLPGHGRAQADSHETLPVVDQPLEVLRKTDFAPFKLLADLPLGMTAHVLYPAVDPDQVATWSPKVIRLIREEIGFKGILMCDDVSMKALEGDMATRTRRAVAAGCDVILHCNGEMSEMEAIAQAAPEVSAALREKIACMHEAMPPACAFDAAAAEAELAHLISAAA